ncbi:hypothetical protein J5N97_001310 [Dioscorea zingiberensis]|uniref:DUF2062 domain-containing protein n=1 Tax=Dioscorea zingiberensis TaxID=325984 RepID=A0A9D5BTW4_9LILI|nr:hypothetical protein J5N97_001310 [Dioscorea zingiberensis]
MAIWMSGLASWFNKKLIDPLLQIVKRGAEPKQIAFSTAWSVPNLWYEDCNHIDLWVTVFLCGAAIALLGNRCHAPSVMLANFVATPIELSLMIPFLRLGEIISGGPHFPLTTDALKKVFTGQASRDVLLSIVHALLGWFVAAPFILGALYIAFLPCFKYLVHKFGSLPPSPKKPVYPQAEIKLKVRDV